MVQALFDLTTALLRCTLALSRSWNQRTVVETQDPRIRRGIEWLKTNQREGGYWWTQSLKNLPDTSNFLTQTGTTFALKTLAAAGEVGGAPRERE